MVKNNRKGLGRGLSSLISTDEEELLVEKTTENEDTNSENIKEIDGNVFIRKTENSSIEKKEESSLHEEIEESLLNKVVEMTIDKIVPNPNQPRTNFDKEELEQLASSIKRNGLIQPILVNTEKNGKHEIIAGERRYRACKMNGMSKIPVIIKETKDDKKLEIALIENIQRTNLNPIEEAYCYKKLIEKKNIGQSELANVVSKGRSTITNSLRLLNLPDEAQKMLYDNKITAGHARAILSIPSEVGQKKLANKIVNEKLSVRDAENMANLFIGQNSKALTTQRPAAPKSFKMVAKSLKSYFETGVKVKRAKGKNKIEIEFKDEKDLERIHNLIVE